LLRLEKGKERGEGKDIRLIELQEGESSEASVRGGKSPFTLPHRKRKEEGDGPKSRKRRGGGEGGEFIRLQGGGERSKLAPKKKKEKREKKKGHQFLRAQKKG